MTVPTGHLCLWLPELAAASLAPWRAVPDGAVLAGVARQLLLSLGRGVAHGHLDGHGRAQ